MAPMRRAGEPKPKHCVARAPPPRGAGCSASPPIAQSDRHRLGWACRRPPQESGPPERAEPKHELRGTEACDAGCAASPATSEALSRPIAANRSGAPAWRRRRAPWRLQRRATRRSEPRALRLCSPKKSADPLGAKPVGPKAETSARSSATGRSATAAAVPQ
jgi:hypothetical protein